jgi:hypothetical protein
MDKMSLISFFLQPFRFVMWDFVVDKVALE